MDLGPMSWDEIHNASFTFMHQESVDYIGNSCHNLNFGAGISGSVLIAEIASRMSITTIPGCHATWKVVRPKMAGCTLGWSFTISFSATPGVLNCFRLNIVRNIVSPEGCFRRSDGFGLSHNPKAAIRHVIASSCLQRSTAGR